MIKKIFKSRLFFPLFLLLAVAAGFGINAYSYYRFPEITEIEPNVAFPGETIEIKGRHFGNSRKGAEVRIAGLRPLSDSYLSWSDELIEVVVPQDVNSGMITVETRRGLSNRVLFTNRKHIPVILSGPQKPGFPYIESIEPENGSIGDLIVINGLNFGNERGNADIFFTSSGKNEEISTDDYSLSGMIKCSEIDYDYESWSDQQIRVYIPDGATSGSVRIESGRGLSNALYFEVTGSPGTKTFSDKMGYQIEYAVEISGINSSGNNSLDIWVPAVGAGLVQRKVETVTQPLPLWEDYMGVMRFRFTGLNPSETHSVSVKSWLERYAVETAINTSRVRTWYDENRTLYKVYTEATELIPAEEASIIKRAASAVGRERNPYLKALSIYNYLLKVLDYSENPSGSGIVENIEAEAGNSYTYSMLFCALSRASGIPARPVTGVLVYNNKQAINHHWAEFYINGFGWIPVDLVLGDGVRFGNFPIDEEIDLGGYYFGSIDNHHITLTRGVVPIKQIAPEGSIAVRSDLYSLQTIYEETTGIKNYSSYWRAVKIIDWW